MKMVWSLGESIEWKQVRFTKTGGFFFWFVLPFYLYKSVTLKIRLLFNIYVATIRLGFV